MYDKLVAKVNNINTSGFVLKTKYDTDKSDLEKKIPNISGLVKKTDYNAKITEIKSKIPSISGLATNSVLTAVENEIPDVGNLFKKNIIQIYHILNLDILLWLITIHLLIRYCC